MKASSLDSEFLFDLCAGQRKIPDCLVPEQAEFVTFLHGIKRRSKRVVNTKILRGFLSKVNCMHMLARLSTLLRTISS